MARATVHRARNGGRIRVTGALSGMRLGFVEVPLPGNLGRFEPCPTRFANVNCRLKRDPAHQRGFSFVAGASQQCAVM
ncbi:hypothetical protein CCP3SC15_530011 [Gammaproteobacteria bacterium]